MTTHTLYLCYFGLREPLVQTQVLPYLRELVAGGIKVSLLTFEPQMRELWNMEQVSAMRARLQAEGISWHLLPYHKSPSLPATLYDIAAGARFACWLARREPLDVLHARTHIGAAMGALAKWRIGQGAKLLFDIRGFIPEEYTDAGVWPENGWLYRGVKIVERQLFKAADGFVVLTERARQILFPGNAEADKRGRPVEVIPCCVDQRRFRTTGSLNRDDVRRKLNVAGRRVIVYVGSFGGWYLTEELMDFMAYAHRRDPATFTMILTQRDAESVRTRLRAQGIGEADSLVASVAPDEVPRYLTAADLALSFIKQCYSKQSSSPTKIAEYLASGLPIISNAGIGDLDALFATERVGAIINDFNEAAYQQALTEIESLQAETDLPARCRNVAHTQFDLHRVGGAKYLSLYQRLLDDAPAHAFGLMPTTER
ncbi:MAG: glycosyltransferase [Acidobacteriota bacterium]